MVSALLNIGLSYTEIKNLTDNEYIMIMATKIAIKEKEAEQQKAATRTPVSNKMPPKMRGLY
jgi:hypothetical protein